jgi:hypothetical protein
VICLNNTQLELATSVPASFHKDYTATWSTGCSTGIEEIDNSIIIPKIVHIYNFLGQEVTPEQVEEGVYIYQYSDGSVKKISKTNKLR